MNQQKSVAEIKHSIWLKCMQMSNCTPQEAVEYISAAMPYINEPLTPQCQNILMISASIGAYYIVRECLLIKVDVNLCDNVGRSALHYAAAIGDIRIFQQIIESGGDPRKRTIGGQTPLTKACIFCQGQIIQWYLNNDLQVFQIADYYGKTPLQMLKLSGQGLYEEVVEVYKDLLLQNSQDTEMKD